MSLKFEGSWVHLTEWVDTMLSPLLSLSNLPPASADSLRDKVSNLAGNAGCSLQKPRSISDAVFKPSHPRTWVSQMVLKAALPLGTSSFLRHSGRELCSQQIPPLIKKKNKKNKKTKKQIVPNLKLFLVFFMKSLAKIKKSPSQWSHD